MVDMYDRESQMKIKNRQGEQRGVAAVEFAVCLPVLILLLLGGIECTSMIFVSQSLNVVAYEGIRAAIKSNGTTADAHVRCDEVIAERDLSDVQVTFTPANVDELERGTQISVVVSAPVNSNSVMRLKFFSGELKAQAIMIKE